MIAIDTNLLIYAHHSGYPEHANARDAIERAAQNPGGWGLPLPCVMEFWAVATNRNLKGRHSRPKEARAFVEALIAAGARVFAPGPNTAAEVLSHAVSLGIEGHRVFDLLIAQVCRESHVRELWTHDKNFVGVAGLRIHDPLQVSVQP